MIREFAESEGHSPVQGQNVFAGKKPFRVECSTYDHFTVSSGRRIDQPYLKLKFSRYPISFGLTKAEALIVLMKHIEEFVDDNAV